MAESEDRTQPASKPRRQQARDQGQVAHSPELTTAAGLLATVAALWFLGAGLVRSLLATFVQSLPTMTDLPADPEGVSSRLRSISIELAGPLCGIMLTAALVSILAHQLQVGGLWAPGLIAPDPARLWMPGRTQGLGAQVGRGVWGWLKAMVLILACVLIVRSLWLEILGLSMLGGGGLAVGAGGAIVRAGGILAAVLLVLGLIDYGLRYRRFELMLQTTPEEHREDQRTMEGDPAVRAQRRQLIRTWRNDQPDLFTGASLLLLGSGGLTLVISGGPPPARVQVRAVARGSQGLRLRRSAAASALRRVDAPALAQRLSLNRSGSAVASADLMAELQAIWHSGVTPEPVESSALS